MNIFVMNITLILIWGYILLYREPSQRKRKIFCILVTIQWILISGLRHLNIGADTDSYLRIFKQVELKGFPELWDNFVNHYFHGEAITDPGYHLTVKIFQLFFKDYQVYLMFVALFFHIPFGIFIYRNSKEPCISFIIYSVLFANFFALTGIRQTIAQVLVTFIGYECIKEKNLKKYLLLTAVAYTIHASSIIALPFYFIANKKLTKKYIFCIILAIPFLFLFLNSFRGFIALFLGENYIGYTDFYENGTLGTTSFSTVFISLTVAALLQIKRILKTSPQSINYYNAIFLALIFLPLTFVDPSNMRVVQYFSPFIILLIPEVFDSLDKKDSRTIIYLAALILVFYLFFRQQRLYMFFWE